MFTDSLDLKLNKNGDEIPAGTYFGFCKAFYGPNSGYAVVDFPEFVHWPYWSAKHHQGITVTDTGKGQADEVKQFEEEMQTLTLASAPVSPPPHVEPEPEQVAGLVG